MERQKISSGSKWEPLFGYSRAVRAGNQVFVSGTVGVNPDGSFPPDSYGQTKRALEIIGAALEQAGASFKDVVRTRLYVTDISDFDDLARAHSEVFGELRPATAVVEVSRLVGEGFRVEVEADAVIG